MNRNHHILFNLVLLASSLLPIQIQGQETSKTQRETFTVGDDAVLNINTSHADIEFEIWDKNQVEVTAVVELGDASEEEAKNYFEKDVVKIIGNSKEIEVSTQKRDFELFSQGDFDFNFIVPKMSFIEPLFENLQIPKLPGATAIPELPPMPPVPHIQFDYKAYEKKGDKYLKEWKREFDENFGQEYRSRLKEWGEKVEEKARERTERLEKRKMERKALIEKRSKLRGKAPAKREEHRAERDKIRPRHGFGVHADDDGPSAFYFSSNGEKKWYKVKKRIMIKMPKSVKLKMNVRHGEVKLASNAMNIRASLSYASLLGSTIDGMGTDIRASYSPVVVQRWNHGQLRTDYSQRVSLKEVGELQLNSVSSNVVIDRLVTKALVINNLGKLRINSVSNNFTRIDISVENGEVDCKLPTVPFSIYMNGTTSDFKYPKALAIRSSRWNKTNVHKGYHIKDRSNRSINISSKYSEVVLKK